jgi:hypothetical protein
MIIDQFHFGCIKGVFRTKDSNILEDVLGAIYFGLLESHLILEE